MAKSKRKRRTFSKEYKAEVVGLIETSGKSVGQIAVSVRPTTLHRATA
jgi:transposase-like protein